MTSLSEEQQEFNVWDSYYAKAVKGEGDEVPKPRSLWWISVNEDIFDIIIPEVKSYTAPFFLEAGCGAAKSSFDLIEKIPGSKLALLDISPNALKFAEMQAKKRNIQGTEFTNGSIFNMPYKDETFDMVWNVGLIEHYTKDNIEKIIYEMNRVLKTGGKIIIGIPNRKCLAVIKSGFLGTKFARRFLPFIPGYRNETEILYSNEEIKNLIKQATGKEPSMKFAGSLLWIGAPEFLVRLFIKFFKGCSFSFITLYILEK